MRKRKADWTQHVFTGLWMPYWSSALRMWSLKSIKTPGMLWKSSVRGERRLGVVLHACSRALVSQVKTKKKKKHTSDCKKTKDSFVLRNEHLKEKKHWRRWENVSCEWGIFLHNLTFSYKCMFLCSPSLTVQQNRASNYAFREKVLYLLLWTPSVRQVFCRKNPPLHSKWCVSCSQQQQRHFVWKQIQKELGTYNGRQ